MLFPAARCEVLALRHVQADRSRSRELVRGFGDDEGVIHTRSPRAAYQVRHLDPRARVIRHAEINHAKVADEAADGQGLTLVHFSAQPKPFLTQNTP